MIASRVNETKAKHPDVYYGYMIVQDKDGFYRIENYKNDRPIPQKLSIRYVDEEGAILALHIYHGESR